MDRLDLILRFLNKLMWMSLGTLNLYSVLLSVSEGTLGSDRIDALSLLMGILCIYELFKE